MEIKKEVRDLAFDKTIEYVYLIKPDVSREELMFIGRVVGNYEHHITKLLEEFKE